MRSRVWCSTLSLICVLLPAGLLLGQSVTGVIGGLVTDPNGASVPSARVTARNTATNAQTSVWIDETGFSRLANLPPAEYTVEVEASGFRKAAHPPPVRLSSVDALRLEVGPVTESVTVEAAASEVNTEDAQLGKTVRDIPELPLLSGDAGRNVLSLTRTQPGVTANGNVNGHRGRSNNYILDGADSNDHLGGTSDAVQTLSPHAVAEFRVITGAMKAEYGRSPGATVIVTTRSGGNAFHGIASEILRNTRLNAVPFFFKSVAGGTREQFASGAPRKPLWIGNDFDANLGGPLRKDKSFFFVSYLGFRRRQGDTRSATVPNDAERAAIEAQGTREARLLLALVPRALSGRTLLSSPPNPLNRDQGLVKIDHSVSQANRFSATYFIDDQAETSFFSGPGFPVPGIPNSNTTRWQNIVLRDTHSFSARLFQEFRASFHRRGDLLLVPLSRAPLSSFGLDGIVADNPDIEGPPDVRITGFGRFGNPSNTRSFKRNNYQVVDNVSYVRGRHSYKFGGEYRTISPNTNPSFLNNGAIIISGSGTQEGSPLVTRRIPGLSPALNDFANGYAASFQQRSAGRVRLRQRFINLFVQDDWKLRPNLTLNLGWRWEYDSDVTEIRDQAQALRPGQQSSVFPDAPLGLVYPGDAGISRSTYREDLNNFGPRFGFAWDPFRNGRISVRGGFGLFYDAPSPDSVASFGEAAPYNLSLTVRNTAYASPWERSLANPIPQPFPYRPPNKGERFDFARLGTLPLNVADPDLATPYTQQWTLQIQSRIRQHWLVETGYVGSASVKLQSNRQLNPAVPGPGATEGNTDLRRVLNQGHPQSARYNGAVFGSVIGNLSDANSNYHSLQVSVTRRFAGGFQMSHAYTWAHSIDSASSSSGLAGVAGTRRIDSAQADRGNSNFDTRHRYVLTYVYELPFWKEQTGALGRLLGGWGVSGITAFQTGGAFDITEPTDRCLCNSGGQRPDYLGGEVRFFDPRSTSAWFDPAPFRRVPAGAARFGNLGRNVFHGPGINNWDMVAFKRIKLAEGHRLEFRVESLNLFNHTQFTSPIASIGNADFGRVQDTRDPRIVQLALRYTF